MFVSTYTQSYLLQQEMIKTYVFAKRQGYLLVLTLETE
jgi:hypothetical protein